MPAREFATLLPQRTSEGESCVDSSPEFPLILESAQEQEMMPFVTPSQRRRRRIQLASGLLAAGGLLAAAAATYASGRHGASRSGVPSNHGPVELAMLTAKSQAGSECHTATKGESCHTDVVYAMKHWKDHPEWYEGLSKKSSFEDFQDFMSGQVLNSGRKRCPKPCGLKTKPTTTPAPEKKKGCHTTGPGESCYNHVIYTRQEAEKYPKWYPGITGHSNLKDVQHYLQQENVCPEPCGKLKDHKKKNKTADVDCRTARPGETCFADILYAMSHIKKHPNWYPGLTNYSKRTHFQAFLHSQKAVDAEAAKKRCPKPCDDDAVESVHLRALCHTADEGDACWNSIVYGATEGAIKHPEWYSRKVNHTLHKVNEHSSLEEFQLFLFKGPESRCPKRPCPCHTHVAGDECYHHMKWVLKHGIRDHPDHFEGLTEDSSLYEVQLKLHTSRVTPCLRPCVPAPWKK